MACWCIHSWSTCGKILIILFHIVEQEEERWSQPPKWLQLQYVSLSSYGLISRKHLTAHINILEQNGCNKAHEGKGSRSWVLAKPFIEKNKANIKAIVIPGFVLNRQTICFIKSNIFCQPWRSQRGPPVRGSHLPSQSQTHQSSWGTQLSIWPWSGNPFLSDPPQLPSGRARGRGRASQPRRAKPSQATSACLPINTERETFTPSAVIQPWQCKPNK